MSDTPPNPISEIDPASLDLYFNMEVDEMTDEVIEKLVDELTAQSATWNDAPPKRLKKSKAESAPPVNLSIDDLLG